MMRRKKGRTCSLVLATWWREAWDVLTIFSMWIDFCLIFCVYFLIKWNAMQMTKRWFFVCFDSQWKYFLLVKLQLSFRIYTAIDNSLVYYLATLVVQVVVIAVWKEHTKQNIHKYLINSRTSHKHFRNSCVLFTHHHISSNRFLFLPDFPPVAIPLPFVTAFHFP